MSAGLGFLNIQYKTEWDNDFSWLSRRGFSFGVFINLPISENIRLQPEFNYVQKGARLQDIGEEHYGTNIYEKWHWTSRIRINYIEVPILGVLTFSGRNWGAQPFLFLGPSIAFRQSAEDRWEEEFEYREDDYFERDTDSGKEDLKEVIKGNDFSFHIGGGISFGRDSRAVKLTVRYILGASNIFVNEEDDFYDEFDIKRPTAKNRGFLITAGFGF